MRRYNALGRRLLANLREGGERKHAIMKALAVHWGYSVEVFEETVQRLKDNGQLLARRRQGGIHLEAAK